MQAALEIGLSAALIALQGNEPVILVARQERGGTRAALPFGPFEPLAHRTMERGLREWVERQTGLSLGYVEQLYTFGDRGRHAQIGDSGPHVVSVGYLALTECLPPQYGAWRRWYDFFPWEDHRAGRPAMLDAIVRPHLAQWANHGSATPHLKARRQQRIDLAFGADAAAWDEERVLDRFELMYEAGLVAEAEHDGRLPGDRLPDTAPGIAMAFDHRRILATAMARLRGKIRYRPVIFELLPHAFTLLTLQRAVEAILGSRLHKQNFRRQVIAGGLVENTTAIHAATGGRPATLYRFRETPSRVGASGGVARVRRG